ncbi:DNA polymerase [Novispirillum sp. DQ9]|uniref:DNA polymerase n=1 Tax=Novispirillum sp. DQ9 TaxID=3398612 RepID=UPI003C7A7019
MTEPLGRDKQDVAPTSSKESQDIDVVADVEWTADGGRKNRVLAYGLSLYHAGQSVTKIVYPLGPKRHHRRKLGRLLGDIIDAATRKGILSSYPERVTLITHYGRGDLAACRDFDGIKREVNALKGAFATTGQSAAIEIETCPKSGLPEALLPRMPLTRQMGVGDPSGNYRMVQVTFRDTSLLVPEDGRKSLDAIGALVGVPKVELPEGFTKDRMDLLLEKEPALFERYLRADLEIPYRYYARLRSLLRGRGLRDVPPTLGACAVALFRQTTGTLRDAGGNELTQERLFGTEITETRSYSRASGRYVTRRITEVSLARRLSEHVMAAGYHGGRTETACTGPSEPGRLLYDLDLRSAYPSAMVGLRIPDYDATFMSTAVDDYQADVLGVAEVEFDTPRGVAFPPFGVRTDHGLVFPRRGKTTASAPEIAAARHLGVAVRILRGFIIPWTRDDLRPYQAFVADLTEWRSALKRPGPDGRPADTLESLVVKTITNSLYGKTAQAVRPRNVFDSRTGGDRPLSPSSITNPAFAAYITGLVRAAIAEMLNGIPAEHHIVSVSTDGFLTTAAVDDIDVSGPACRTLSDNRLRLTGEPAILEVKRAARQVVSPRNRAAFTAMPEAGWKPVLAKGSVKIPAGIDDANSYLLGLYLDRTSQTSVPRQDLIALRDQWRGNADLVAVQRSPLLNLEPDHKRRLIDPEMVEIGGGPHQGRHHIATSSEPFDTVDDMLETRALFIGWRHTTGRCLKSTEDWVDWEDYRLSTLAARQAGRRARRTAGGSADDLKRQFLRALVRGDWGLSLGGQTYADIAEWLTVAGYRTSVSAVKNARRGADNSERARRGDAPLVPQSVAATERTLGLLKVLLERFPDFQYRQAFVSGHVDKVDAGLRTTRRSRAS